MAYGREEQSVHRVADVLREWWFYEWDVDEDDPTRATMQRLTSFTYGPSPKDWHFSLTEVEDYSCNEFWDMVDHPERAIP
jgi:hypothetical protein